MANLQIIIGTQMGGTEYVAEHLAQCLSQSSINSTVHEQPNLQEIDTGSPWLICTSTHGAGEFPDNIQAFVEQVTQSNELSELHFAIIGIGDSSYDTFNFAAKNMEKLLASKGATKLVDTLEIDVLGGELPEDTAEQWLPQLVNTLTA